MINLNRDMATVDMRVVDLHSDGHLKVFYFLQKAILESSKRITNIEGI